MRRLFATLAVCLPGCLSPGGLTFEWTADSTASAGPSTSEPPTSGTSGADSTASAGSSTSEPETGSTGTSTTSPVVDTEDEGTSTCATCGSSSTTSDTTATTAGSTSTSTSGGNNDPAVERYVFASSAAAHDGALGGLEGADATCQQYAADAGLSGVFRAWLGNKTTNPAERFDVDFEGVYMLRDETIVAEGWFDLTDAMLNVAIATDEHGFAIDGNAWTGVNGHGDTLPLDCSEWTSPNPAYQGWTGDIGEVDDSWSKWAAVNCGAKLHLYCIQDG